MSSTGRTDIFPSTHATWLHTRIESVCDTNTATSALAARELREHLMLRYHKPLCAYVRGSSLRTLGEPEELVHEFFARALADDMFLVRWKARGNPLRRWMMNGLLLHARGVVRDRARNREHSGKNPSVIDSIAQSSEPSAEQAFESAWAMAMLDAACQDVQDSFAKDDRAQAFDIFRKHVIDGKSYPEVHAQLGVDPVRCATEVRAVTRALRDSLLERLREDGVTGESIDAEASAILRLIGQT